MPNSKIAEHECFQDDIYIHFSLHVTKGHVTIKRALPPNSVLTVSRKEIILKISGYMSKTTCKVLRTVSCFSTAAMSYTSRALPQHEISRVVLEILKNCL